LLPTTTPCAFEHDGPIRSQILRTGGALRVAKEEGSRP
jgi:hypothetical protein